MNSIMMKRKGIIKREEEEEKDGKKLVAMLPAKHPASNGLHLAQGKGGGGPFVCISVTKMYLGEKAKKGARTDNGAPSPTLLGSVRPYILSLLPSPLVGGYINGKKSQEKEEQHNNNSNKTTNLQRERERL